MRKAELEVKDVSDETILVELAEAGDRSTVKTQADKKNYAERLSRALAQRFANALRPHFEGILPDSSGKGQESKARSAKGYKKLDVNYSTPELGLGLGVSIKTINFVDPKSKRYTKNYTRVDAELRAEATDYHDRQPYSVMVAVIFCHSTLATTAVMRHRALASRSRFFVFGVDELNLPTPRCSSSACSSACMTQPSRLSAT